MTLSIGGLAYRRMADAPVGNLIYVVNNNRIDLAFCVRHTVGRSGGNPSKAALKLLGDSQYGRMPIVDTAASHCIDWGLRPTVRWHPPLKFLPRNAQQPAEIGYLLLVGDRPAISSHYADGRGDRMYWSLLTGESVEVGDADFILLMKWTLGVTAVDGSFLPLASYPDDYGKAASKS